MIASEYETLYGLRNRGTGKLVLMYWASSQKHKALFSSLKAAELAAQRIDDDVEIVEIK